MSAVFNISFIIGEPRYFLIIKQLWTIIVHVIYQAWEAVFHHQMKHGEESWKYDAQQSIFDEFRGVSSDDETLCQMLDITSQTKWF